MPRPDEHVGLVVAGGEHQDRHRAGGLEPAAHLVAVEPGEHDVEHHAARGPTAAARSSGDEPVVHLLDVEALGTQPGGHRLGDGPLVLDDQDPGCPHVRRA